MRYKALTSPATVSAAGNWTSKFGRVSALVQPRPVVEYVMLKSATFCFAASASALTGFGEPAFAQAKIDTLDRGDYVCELPGDASGRAGVEQAQAGFTILSASRYSSPQGNGTYLRQGDRVAMTSGPRNGESYRLRGRNFLRKLDADGQPTRLRCLRRER